MKTRQLAMFTQARMNYPVHVVVLPLPLVQTAFVITKLPRDII